jgi:hypothetical protein
VITGTVYGTGRHVTDLSPTDIMKTLKVDIIYKYHSKNLKAYK